MFSSEKQLCLRFGKLGKSQSCQRSADKTSARKTNTCEARVIQPADHGQLTIAFPLLLARDGEVFTREDVEHLGLTVCHGLGRLGGGVLLGSVTGDPKFAPSYVSNPEGWIVPACTNAAAKDMLIAFYLNYQPAPSALDLATRIALKAK